MLSRECAGEVCASSTVHFVDFDNDSDARCLRFFVPKAIVDIKRSLQQDEVAGGLISFSAVEQAFMDGTATAEMAASHPYLAAAFDDAVEGYPGALRITKYADMAADQRVVEARMAEKLSTNIDQAVKDYWNLKKGTNEFNHLNVDFARDLSPEYLLNPEYYTRSTNSASSALAREIWTREVAGAPSTGKKVPRIVEDFLQYISFIFHMISIIPV